MNNIFMKIYLSRKFCKVSHCSFETVQLNKAIITYWEKFESFHSTTPKESFKLFCNGNLFAEATGIIGRISTVEFLFTKRSFLYILSYYLITWYKCIFFRLSGLAYSPIFCTKNLKKKNKCGTTWPSLEFEIMTSFSNLRFSFFQYYGS